MKETSNEEEKREENEVKPRASRNSAHAPIPSTHFHPVQPIQRNEFPSLKFPFHGGGNSEGRKKEETMQILIFPRVVEIRKLGMSEVVVSCTFGVFVRVCA